MLLDERGNVKLMGFALAGLFDPSTGDHVTNLLHATCGTPEYTAPEVSQCLTTRRLDMQKVILSKSDFPSRRRGRTSLPCSACTSTMISAIHVHLCEELEDP